MPWTPAPSAALTTAPRFRRIFHLVEGEEKLGLRRLVEELAEIPPFETGDLGHDPLVLTAEATQPLARLPVHRDPMGPGEGDDLLGPRIELPFRENDLPDAARGSFEGRPDGVEP